MVHRIVASHRSKGEGEGDPGRVTARKNEIGGYLLHARG
jgi:hypothetical protein